MTQRVYKIIITFKDRSKIEFYGAIEQSTWKEGRLTRLAWRNVSFDAGPTLTQRRLTYVDLSQIRAIEEVNLGGKAVLDSVVWVNG